MDNNQTTRAGSPIVEGLTAFDAAGEKVGTVYERDTQGGYVVVQKGWLFPKDLFVPFSAVSRVDGDGVYLNVTKDAMSTGQWESPPEDTPSTLLADTTSDMQQTARATSRDTATDAADVRVPVREEELRAGTRVVESGRVHLHKDVIEEQQTLTVPVTHEEVRVERGPVSGAVAPGPDAFVARDIEVPLMGEEVVTSKRAQVVEEVRLHKDVVTEQEQVSETVRKERVEVDGVDTRDDTSVSGSTASRSDRLGSH